MGSGEAPRSMGKEQKTEPTQAQNMAVWHNFQSYDPEATGGGLGGAQYPQLVTYTLGVNLGL